MVWDGDGQGAKPIPNHPLRRLLRTPTPVLATDDVPVMGEDELWQYAIAYMALGGNAYLVSSLNSAGLPVEVYPYHAGQVRPMPGAQGQRWILGYEYLTSSGAWVRIDPTKFLVAHLKWPLPDPEQPWQAQAPLRSAARAVDTDSELDVYLYSLLKNDAVPRMIVTQSPERMMTDDEVRRAKTQFGQNYGGENRGGVLILESGATVDRLSLNLQELAFDALRRVPEARIAAAFGVPAILAGLNVGLEQSTYSNYEQARKAFTQDRLVPLWRATASKIEATLGAAFGGAICRHDLSEVASLQDDVNERWQRVTTAFTAGYIGFQEARAALGYGPPTTDDRFAAPLGRDLLTLTELAAPPEPAAQPTEIPPKMLPAPPATKARPSRIARALQRIRVQVATRMAPAIDQAFDDLATRVAQRATGAKKLPTVADLLTRTDEDAFKALFKQWTVTLCEASWGTWNTALAVDLAFDVSDPAVVAAIRQSGSRVAGILDTTRDALREALATATEQGWTIDQLVNGVGDDAGIKDIVAETYANRSRAIARTELGEAQATATVGRYRAAGVDKVTILDNGVEDSDPVCVELNGTVQTLAWYEANKLQHPNCLRCAAPYFGDS